MLFRSSNKYKEKKDILCPIIVKNDIDKNNNVSPEKKNIDKESNINISIEANGKKEIATGFTLSQGNKTGSPNKKLLTYDSIHDVSRVPEDPENFTLKSINILENSEESKSSTMDEEKMRLNRKIKELKKQIQILSGSKAELECKLREMQLNLLKEKRTSLAFENELNNLKLSIKEFTFKKDSKSINEMTESNLLKGYKSQIKSLEAALEDSEVDCKNLLKEKKEKLHKEIVSMYSMTLMEYFNRFSPNVILDVF